MSSLALAVSLEEMGIKEDNARAKLACDKLLIKRLANYLTTTSLHHVVLANWTTVAATSTWQNSGLKHLSAQDEDAELKAKFAPLAQALAANEDKIVAELAEVQGQSVDIGGYYAVDHS